MKKRYSIVSSATHIKDVKNDIMQWVNVRSNNFSNVSQPYDSRKGEVALGRVNVKPKNR
jgi:hypothetical protein